MSKTRSRQPASDARSQRRSLVELTAVLSRAVDDGLRVMPAGPVAAAADDPRPPEQRAEGTAEAPPKRATRSRDGAASDSATEMVVQIAKDYQNSMLDSVRAGLNAALDHAKDFAETKVAGEAAGDAGPENDGLAALGAATATFRAEALELMQANFARTLDYARELAGARTAAEVVELTGTQARKSCELMLKQADALKALAQAMTQERTGRT